MKNTTNTTLNVRLSVEDKQVMDIIYKRNKKDYADKVDFYKQMLIAGFNSLFPDAAEKLSADFIMPSELDEDVEIEY